jgi:hypothetical protein
MQASRMITHLLGFSFFHGTITLFRPASWRSAREIMALATQTVENRRLTENWPNRVDERYGDVTPTTARA